MNLKAQKLRTVMIQKSNLTDLHTALDTLMNGGALTAGGSGVVAEEEIENLTLIAAPTICFDGFNWNAFLFVTTA